MSTQDDIWGDIPDELRTFEAKWLLNGFPKSGLHLLVNMMRPVCKPMVPGQFHPKVWVGTFQGHSWTTEWTNIRLMCYHVSRLFPGYYFKSHCAYRPDIAAFIYLAGIAHVFIYRDLRDVAVSQAHHILDERDEQFIHPGKELYRAMDSFHDVLTAVITGIDEYPGVMERFQYWTPWLDADWVLKVRFEDARQRPMEVAGRLLRYGVERVAGIIGMEIEDVGELYDEARRAMCEAAADTDKSPTFRKGKVGGWREVFTPEHVRLFKEADEEGWLVELGYEESPDWGL